MRVAASTGLIAPYESSPRWDDAAAMGRQLGRLRERGFEHVDLSDIWFPLADLADEQVAVLSDAVASSGLQVAGASVIDVLPGDADEQRASIDRGARALHHAAALGARIVSIGMHSAPKPVPGSTSEPVMPWIARQSPPQHTDQDFQRAADLLKELSDLATELTLDLSLEMNEFSLVSSGIGCVRLIEMIARDNVGINPDLGSLVRVGWPLVEAWDVALNLVAPYTNYWHVKNCQRIPLENGRFVSTPSTLAEGVIDYRKAVELVVEARGDLPPIVIEHYGGDVLWFAKNGLDYLTQAGLHGSSGVAPGPC